MRNLNVPMPGFVSHSWRHYAEEQLPTDLTDRERLIAHDSFLGGARSTYGVIAAFSQLAPSQNVLTNVMESIGRELGIDDDPPRRS